jgi:branched-chain amino acid transport system substrate-binding protein
MIFRVAPNNAVLLGGTAKYAVEELGVKTVAILHIDSHFGENQREVFTKYFESYGGKVLLTRPALEGEKDFNAVGMEMIAAKPDAICFFHQAATGIKQLADIMPKDMKLIGHNIWANPAIRKLAGDAINRMDVFTDVMALKVNDDPYIKKWIDTLETRIGSEFDPHMARAACGMQILKLAIENAGTTDGIAVMREVHKMKNVKTILGDFTYDPRDGEALKEVLLIKPVNADITNDKAIDSVRAEGALYPEPPDFTEYFGEGYLDNLLKLHGLD